jgi:hypothetical protein
LISGRRLAEGRRAAQRVHTGAFVALINHFEKHYPDEAERANFAERLKADLSNPDYHLSFDS